MSIEEAEKQYNEYLEGHIGNVVEALELLNTLDIPIVNDNYDKLKEICSNHDASKYDEEEYIPYREHFYPVNDEEKLKSEAFEQAVRHHINNNKHHWDYWVNENNELEIPDEEEYKLHCVERCCDWLAMANQHDEISNEWYNANKDAMIMPDYGFAICDEIMSKVPEKCNLSFKGVRGELDESFKVYRGDKGYLVEASMSQLKRTTISEDPTRAKKSKNVQSKYIGISKYGVLNFETTSETYSGVKWYQEVHFPSFNGFMNIVENGDEIEPADVKKVMSSDNIKISCDDPSFLYWAWKYKAYRDSYGLEKETRAPKRNNTRLKGALCKHLYSVIELINENRILELITRDLNQFCRMQLGKENTGYQDSEGMMKKDLKADQYDYNIDDILKSILTEEQFKQYMEGTKLEDLNLTDEQMKEIDDAIKNMRSAGQYKLKSELEKQFEPAKRGRKITRDDIKLTVGNDEEEL